MEIPLFLLVMHFVADFVFQSHWMATNKSKRWDALTLHVTVYSLPFFVLGFQFGAVTFALHLLTDAVTSRITARLWAASQMHWFFVTIGADQLLHAIALGWTWQMLMS